MGRSHAYPNGMEQKYAVVGLRTRIRGNIKNGPSGIACTRARELVSHRQLGMSTSSER